MKYVLFEELERSAQLYSVDEGWRSFMTGMIPLLGAAGAGALVGHTTNPTAGGALALASILGLTPAVDKILKPDEKERAAAQEIIDSLSPEQLSKLKEKAKEIEKKVRTLPKIQMDPNWNPRKKRLSSKEWNKIEAEITRALPWKQWLAAFTSSNSAEIADAIQKKKS